MSTPPERHKVTYTLRFDAATLPALGGLCASLNLEVLNTQAIGSEVHMLTRVCPDDIATVATALSCEPRYESPAKVTRGVLVPTYTSPAQEIEARQARARTPSDPPPAHAKPA
jgi:hypothetical protein